MNTMLIKLSLKLQDLMNREEGQDLVEYALLVALVAAAAITGIGKVATAVNLAFSNISASIGS
jgi:pilus assembly protein Flp/PilA